MGTNVLGLTPHPYMNLFAFFKKKSFSCKSLSKTVVAPRVIDSLVTEVAAHKWNHFSRKTFHLLLAHIMGRLFSSEPLLLFTNDFQP